MRPRQAEQFDYANLAGEANTVENLARLLGDFFVYTARPDYIGQIRSHLKDYPHRLENPNFLQFFARVSLMAAEYGFPESSGHILRHRTYFQRDYLHPLHILGLARYLASINLQSAEQKIKVIDHWNKVRGPSIERDLKIWSFWNTPVNGEVRTGPVDDPGYLKGGSRLKGLPICIPEIPFHRSLVGVSLSQYTADKLQREEFEETILPLVVEVFAGIADMESIFSNPLEWEINKNPKRRLMMPPLLPARLSRF